MRKNIDGLAIILMVMICGVWGCQQVAIKSVAEQISPGLQVGIRSAVAAFFVYLLFNRKDRIFHRLKNRRVLTPGLAVGILFALEFLLVVTGIRLTSTSHTTLFLYTAPLFTAVGLHFLIPEEKLTRLQWIGILLAFTGLIIAVRFTSSSASTGTQSLIGDLCAILAGLSWGVTSIIIRCSSLSSIPSSCTLFYQLATAAVIILLASVFTGQTTFIATPAALASLIFQTVVVAFISYLAWFTLLRYYQVSSLGTLILMTPVMGIAAGVYFLGETLYHDFVIGSLLILTGLVVCRLGRRKLPLPLFTSIQRR
jgi:drug/metabolite transporter (DMT)-like permease